MSADNEKNDFALVPRPPGVIEKAEPGAKCVLSGMVADTLALVKKEQARKTRPPRIVIVDDEEVTRYFYKHLLKNWHKETTLQEFSNSDDAWKELSQTDPDLLITRMPTTGRFLLPLLAERKVKYPILVASGFFDEKEVRQRAGPNLNVSFLPLPFSAEQFYRELLIHLGHATISKTTLRLTQEFELKWRFGARTGELIAKVASRFDARIQISNGEETADAKKEFDLLMLSTKWSKVDDATKSTIWSKMTDNTFEKSDFPAIDLGCGDHVKVSADGPDAAEAMEALTELFTCGACVEHCIDSACPSRPCLTGYSKDHISYGCYKFHNWDVSRSDKS